MFIYLRCEPSYAEDDSFIMQGTKINSGKLHTPFLRQILDRLKVILCFLVRPTVILKQENKCEKKMFEIDVQLHLVLVGLLGLTLKYPL